MKSLAEQMSVYHQYHTNPNNKYTHFVGVPLIIFAIMIPLGWVHVIIPTVISTNLSWIGIGCITVYYLFLDIPLAIGMLIILTILGWLAKFCYMDQPNWVGGIIFLVAFIGGWIIQLIGHLFEGRKPALIDNLFQIFVAPIFLLAEVCFMLGFYQTLQTKVKELAGTDDNG